MLFAIHTLSTFMCGIVNLVLVMELLLEVSPRTLNMYGSTILQ